MPGPLFLVRDKGQFRDERFERNRRVEYLNRLQLHPQGKGLIPITEFRRSGKDPFGILINARHNLKAPGDGSRKGGLLVNHLLADIDEEGVTDGGLMDLVHVPALRRPRCFVIL